MTLDSRNSGVASSPSSLSTMLLLPADFGGRGGRFLAARVLQLRTSTSFSPGEYTELATVHWGVLELPLLVRSASMGGLDTAIWLSVTDMNFTGVLWNEGLAAAAAFRAALSICTCWTRGLSSA